MITTEFPHYSHVEGWLLIEPLVFTSYFVDRFLANSLFDSLEIGVHHGKFLIGIENLTPAKARCIAVDLFSRQDLNIDRSGEGNLKAFMRNCEKFAAHPKRVIAMEGDSFNLDPQVLGRGKFGIVSIDGGHTERHTINDLSIAQELVAPNGLVILDDILNQDWMGVLSGACAFFGSAHARRLSPFAVGFNKLFCCHYSMRERVRQTIAADAKLLAEIGVVSAKTTEFMGNQIVSLHPAGR